MAYSRVVSQKTELFRCLDTMKTGKYNLLKYILLTAVLLGVFLVADPLDAADGSSYKEYNIKAAFIYNFMKFVSWSGDPQEDDENVDKPQDNDEPIVIGVIGKNPFGKSMAPILVKKIRGRGIVLIELMGYNKGYDKNKKKYWQAEELNECRLLFISSSEQRYNKEIIELVSKKNILTVSETSDFLDDGGIINFVTYENKVRFEINIIAAKRADIKIRSQLLRLAKKVIKD